MKKILFCLAALILAPVVNAGVIDCGTVSVGALYVQGDRGDSSKVVHENKLLIGLGSEKSAVCSSIIFAALPQDDPLYHAVLSMAMMAYKDNIKLRIAVRDEAYNASTYPVAYVNFPWK